MAAASMTLFTTSVHAGTCQQDDREQYFVRAATNSGGTPTRQGTLSWILMANRDLDTGCSASVPPGQGCTHGFTGAATLSTAHTNPGLVSTTDQGKQVEIGWLEVWHDADTSSQAQSRKDWYIFTEKEVDFNCTQWSTQLAPNLDPNTQDIWKISAVNGSSGTTDWHLSVNFIIQQGYVDIETYNTDWNAGVPLGETERFGGGTGMSDDQTNLQWKTSTGTWVDWQDNKCWQHVDMTAGEWDYVRASGHAFDIEHQSAGSC
jgi:hypothetical protein